MVLPFARGYEQTIAQTGLKLSTLRDRDTGIRTNHCKRRYSITQTTRYTWRLWGRCCTSREQGVISSEDKYRGGVESAAIPQGEHEFPHHLEAGAFRRYSHSSFFRQPRQSPIDLVYCPTQGRSMSRQVTGLRSRVCLSKLPFLDRELGVSRYDVIKMSSS